MGTLRFICGDMWKPYLKVIAKKAGQSIHVPAGFSIMGLVCGRSNTSLLKTILAYLFRRSGIPSLVRHTIARHRVTVLLYHDPSAEVMTRHLNYLVERYSPISLEQMVDAIRKRSLDLLPNHPLVITLDDGHRRNRELEDVFARYKVRPTIYLCSRIVTTRRRFWFSAPSEGHERLKRLRHEERLMELYQNHGFLPEREEISEPEALSIEDLRRMMPRIYFGSHTRFHPVLTTCSDRESHLEIVESKKDLEEILSRPSLDFAYPNGDYTRRETNYIGEAGYRSARTLNAGWNGVDTSPFELKSMVVPDDASVDWLSVCVTGVPMFIRYAKQGSWGGKYPVIRLSGGSA